MISVYITFKDEAEARKIATHLLKKKLIACANLFPVTSLYSWRGKIVDEKEMAMMAKAPKGNFERIRSEVKAMHSYEVPCIVSLPVEDKDDDFHKWVGEEAKGLGP